MSNRVPDDCGFIIRCCHLHSAASELLEALEAIVGAIVPGTFGYQTRDLTLKAQIAISKAKGKLS